MEKRKKIAALMLSGIVVFAACDTSAAGPERVETQTVGSPETGALSDDKKAVDLLIDRQEEASVKRQVVIYYSNSRADGLESETMEIGELTPETLIAGLTKHNIVSIDTKVNRLETGEEEGRTVLTLDLSKAFLEYLKTMGENGEAIIIAAVTDTFLEAYGADAMYITVEDCIMETKHKKYDEPLLFLE